MKGGKHVARPKQPGTSTEPVPPVPAAGSPRKHKRQDETRNETGGKAPKKPEPEQKKTKMSECQEKGEKAPKTPKASERKQTAGERPKPMASTTTSSKTPGVPQHVDDDEFDLDVRTGKFVRKQKDTTTETRTEKDDESTGRKRKSAMTTSKTRRHKRRVEGS